MPNNRAIKEIDQKSFLAFVFMGKEPPTTGLKLTGHQQTVYDLMKKGMTIMEVVESTGYSRGSVYDSLGKIRAKGWLI